MIKANPQTSYCSTVHVFRISKKYCLVHFAFPVNLSDKLKLYGITGNTLNWFISYLDKRYQTCKVNNVGSSRKLIECGVPQGSNLGPLLFLLYVNDLPNCIDQAEPSMFADDTNISTSAGSVEKLETQLNIELDKI